MKFTEDISWELPYAIFRELPDVVFSELPDLIL